MAKYTFSTLGTDGKRYYPCKPLYGKVVGAGLLDYEWTEDINKAITWKDKQCVETIMLEFCDTILIDIKD